jgi:hypothetical protein
MLGLSVLVLRDPDQDSLGIKKRGGGDVEIKG